MAHIYADRVKETASNKPNASTAFNLPDTGATGYRSFDSVLASTDTCIYGAENGTDWEVGVGTFTAGAPDTLTRTTILSSSTGSAIDFSAGADVSVYITADASRMNHLQKLYNDHAFIIRQNGNVASQQSITASAYTPIEGDVLNTTVIDRSSAVSNVGTGGSAVTFTAPETGIYQIGGLSILNPLSADSRLIVLLAINGGDDDDERLIISRGWNTSVGGTAGFGGSHMLSLTANDTVTLEVWTDSTGSPTLSPEDSRQYFYGRLVSRSS